MAWTERNGLRNPGAVPRGDRVIDYVSCVQVTQFGGSFNDLQNRGGSFSAPDGVADFILDDGQGAIIELGCVHPAVGNRSITESQFCGCLVPPKYVDECPSSYEQRCIDFEAAFQVDRASGRHHLRDNSGKALGTYLGELRAGQTQVCGCSRTPGNGCFAPETRMLLGDRSGVRAAKDIVAGDLLWNPITQEAVRVKRVVHSPERAPLIRLGYDDTVLTVSQTHPIVTAQGLKRARELSFDDLIIGRDGQLYPVTVLKALPVEEGQWVINFEFERREGSQYEYVLADGIVAGDLTLQVLLNRGLQK